MNTVFIKINRWDGNPLVARSSLALTKGDVVIAETADGSAAAIVENVVGEDKVARRPGGETRNCEIARKANLNDLQVIGEHHKKEKEALDICRQEVKKANLPMKPVGAAYSFDGGNITFAFIADGRVDFRDLVKNLSKQFQRSIRLHQIGARDESRHCGGYGICGREQCCVKFKGNLPSITSEMAKAQQIAHRGSERISGICGRLMCCLAYEADQYRKLLESFPRAGETVDYKGTKAVVREVNVLSGNMRIELADRSVITIKKEEIG